MGHLIALGCWIFAIWLIRRDSARREGISTALWIPTLWSFILLSRPLSMWLGFGGGIDTMEGSPLDRLFYFGMIGLAFVIVANRGIEWGPFVVRNWPVMMFYGYLLVSVMWAESPFVSTKRWIKDFGNIFVALVILTERNPIQAIRAVFVRCAYVLFPLSIVFLRYLPELGRRYTRSGGLEVTGVTTQKNSLGILVTVCGLFLLWDWLEKSREDWAKLGMVERRLPILFLLIGIYLLYLCDSQTSILCLIVGSGVMLSGKLPFLRGRVGAMGTYTVVAILAYLLLDEMFGLKDAILGAMGRDSSFTGRTDVWRELLALKTDWLIGTGFLSFWSDMSYQSRLPDWVAFSAHNGYLETYIDGGMIGVLFLVLMLLVIGFRANRRLAFGGNYALAQFAVLLMMLIGNFSESHFARMGPMWFLFLLTALEVPERTLSGASFVTARSDSHVRTRPEPVSASVASPCLS